jgi:hypothetical protein
VANGWNHSGSSSSSVSQFSGFFPHHDGMSPTRRGVAVSKEIKPVNLSLVVLASTALALAGCGGGSSSPGVAHLSSSTPGASPASGGSSSSPESGGSSQQTLVAYSQCMRSHGVPEFPEPTEGRLLIQRSDHNGRVTGVNPQSSQFQAAAKACAKLAPNGGKPPSPAQQAKAQESALKFSACMRTHGVPNFPDPTLSGGGVRMTLKAGGANGIDPNSPQFKAAQKTCQSNLPGPPGVKDGPGGGQVSSSGGPGGSGGAPESNAVIAP